MRNVIVYLIAVIGLSFVMAAPSSAQEWAVHIDREGKFVVMMPGAPEEIVEKNHYDSGLHIRRVTLPHAGYFVMFGDYATARYDMRTMLNRERDGLSKAFKIEPVSQKTSLLKYGTRELMTVEFDADSDDGKTHYIWRIFFRDQRFYAMGVGAAKETDLTERAKFFFNSFVLIE